MDNLRPNCIAFLGNQDNFPRFPKFASRCVILMVYSLIDYDFRAVSVREFLGCCKTFMSGYIRMRKRIQEFIEFGKRLRKYHFLHICLCPLAVEETRANRKNCLQM